LAYAVGLPGLLVLGLFLWRAAVDWETVAADDPWTFLVASLAMNAFTLPLLLWRNEIVLDKAAGKLTYWWGFRFWKRGRREYDLAAFKAVALNDELPYWSTPGGKVTPPVVGGFANNGRWRYYTVALADGETTVPLKEFQYYVNAHRLLVRVGRFLDLPVPQPAARKGWLSAGWHMAFMQLVMITGFIGGALGGFLGALWFYPEGPGKPIMVFLKAAIPFKGWGLPFLLSHFVGFAILGAHLAGHLISLIPATCPPCGGKAYIEWAPPWAKGLAFHHYRCRECGNTWYPPPNKH